MSYKEAIIKFNPSSLTLDLPANSSHQVSRNKIWYMKIWFTLCKNAWRYLQKLSRKSWNLTYDNTIQKTLTSYTFSSKIITRNFITLYVYNEIIITCYHQNYLNIGQKLCRHNLIFSRFDVKKLCRNKNIRGYLYASIFDTYTLQY